MGQAKQRGSYEERKRSALEKRKAAEVEIERRKPSPKVGKRLAVIAACAAMDPTLYAKIDKALTRTGGEKG